MSNPSGLGLSTLCAVLKAMGSARATFLLGETEVRICSADRTSVHISIPREALLTREVGAFSVDAKHAASLIEECEAFSDIEFDLPEGWASLRTRAPGGQFTMTMRCPIRASCYEDPPAPEPFLVIEANIQTLRMLREMRLCEEVSFSANQEGVLVIQCSGEVSTALTHRMLHNPAFYGSDLSKFYNFKTPLRNVGALLALASLSPEKILMAMCSSAIAVFYVYFPKLTVVCKVPG